MKPAPAYIETRLNCYGHPHAYDVIIGTAIVATFFTSHYGNANAAYRAASIYCGGLTHHL